jgi:hypothetical protein
MRRRGDETTTAARMMHKRTTTRTKLSKRRLGPKGSLDSSNAGMTLKAMVRTAVSGFRNHRPRRVTLFNFYVASKSDYRFA